MHKFTLQFIDLHEMTPEIRPIEQLINPLGGQVIELQQLDYPSGGISLLRTRIREKSRFTVFEVDAQTAAAWGEALVRWAKAQVDQRD